MDIANELKLNIQKACKALNVEVNLNDVVIETSKDKTHGDYATNVALKFSRLFSKAPRDVANIITEKLDMTNIDKIEIAGPGFINFFMKNDSLLPIVKKIIEQDDKYGRSERNNIKINLEFVSANPTGILHVGTARGAAYGDSLARILDAAGYDVTKEYYINDAGTQIDHLADSIYQRYLELNNLPFELGDDDYHGEDIIDIAKEVFKEKGKALLDMDKNKVHSYLKEKGIEIELNRIKKDLADFRVIHDVFSSEKVIRGNDSLNKEIDFLSSNTYVSDGAKFLSTTKYLDDKDRVIVKANGEYTYFLPDIVYHVNKLSRGFDKLIDVLGADHHGYINRMKSALMMHGYKEDILDIELIQMVRFYKDGVEVKASKRTGNAITLREICDEVGVDAMRYFFAMRAPFSHLDFDMNLALEQSSSNPVYYAQYAHARLCSILQSGEDIALDTSAKELKEPSELALLKHLGSFNKIINDAANEKAPFKITNYIHELAELTHSFYQECKVINRDDINVSASRLALCKACQIVMKNALNIIGVNAPTRM